MRRKGVAVAAMAAVGLLAGTATPASAATACVGNGVAESNPGFLATGPLTAAFTFNGKATCQGTPSGPVTGSGQLTGTCNALTGYIDVSGALNGHVTVATHGPVFTLKGTVNGLAFNAAGVFAPKKGNCVTVPLTMATVAFGGAAK